jgi:RNA polymerase sigma-70 factor (ECF subfamily)
VKEPPEGPTDSDQEDIALIRALAGGNHSALERLIRKHHGRVAGLAARMLNSSGPAPDEVAHEVFVKVWRYAARYEPSAKFVTWLLRITRNHVLNEIRSLSRHVHESLDAVYEESDLPKHDPAEPEIHRPDRKALNDELEEAVTRAMADLPENQRVALSLRRFQDLSYEQIAEVMDLSVASVKSTLFRARTALKESLRPYLDGTPPSKES